jgi:hypothetical protein
LTRAALLWNALNVAKFVPKRSAKNSSSATAVLTSIATWRRQWSCIVGHFRLFLARSGP